MKTLCWAVRAQADLVSSVSFYGPLDSEFALRVLREALKAAEFLCEFPEPGMVTRGRGVHKWRVKTTPFLLLYRIVGAEVRITGVAHHARDWERW